MSEDGLRVGKWTIPDSDLEERFDTPGGPGGQHANRNRTAVTVRFDIEASSLPGGIKQKLVAGLGHSVEASAAESRSQWRNRATARKRLAAKLEDALAERPPRHTTKPTTASRERRLRGKRKRSDLKKSRRPPDVE